MHNSQDTSHSQHDNMLDGPMDDPMSDPGDENGQDMDCCDHDTDDQDDACNPILRCGVCTAGLVALNPSTFSTTFGSNPEQFLPIADGIQSRSGSPPLRPPTA